MVRGLLCWYFVHCSILLVLLTSTTITATSMSPFRSHSFFLRSTYSVKGDENQSFHVRQVPGDGGCLFHSIATWLSYIRLQKHVDFDWRLRHISSKLRIVAVQTLLQNETLHLENDECLEARELVKMVGDHYNMTAEEYCDAMLNCKTWGGGPEIVALCNHLKCPIYVYQLATQGFHNKKNFCLELCAKFGHPAFSDKSPLHILCADGRFPNVEPGDHKAVGDHFLALFPCHLPLHDTENEKEEGENGQNITSSYCHLQHCPQFKEDIFMLKKKPADFQSNS